MLRVRGSRPPGHCAAPHGNALCRLPDRASASPARLIGNSPVTGAIPCQAQKSSMVTTAPGAPGCRLLSIAPDPSVKLWAWVATTQPARHFRPRQAYPQRRSYHEETPALSFPSLARARRCAATSVSVRRSEPPAGEAHRQPSLAHDYGGEDRLSRDAHGRAPARRSQYREFRRHSRGGAARSTRPTPANHHNPVPTAARNG